jgi:fructan beta-fructosidase
MFTILFARELWQVPLKPMKHSLTLLVLLFVSPLKAEDRPDIVIADFEGETYGEGWKTTGTAFGKGPAKGTLPNQMPVTGYLGKGLVNSYLGGDASTGTLTSPAFKIERKYLNFLVGGGKYPGKTCVNLLVAEKVVRTATGPNEKPGGSERLDWHTWDVSDLDGKEAAIQIVDDATGGWGHINADHFVQSDAKKQAELTTRTFTIDKTYLHLPVKNGAPMKRLRFVLDKETVREFDIELADGETPDFWAFAEVSAFKGKPLTVETVLTSGSKTLESLKLADDVPDAEKLYREKYRPLFHFTSRFGWLNDPNGLVYLPFEPKGPFTPGYNNGEWNLFYQHNPFGVQWGNMHWGHAVSRDLVRWKEVEIGLYPKKYGDWAFSGSAVLDKGNTSGWGANGKPPLVLAYTSTGRGECIAFSNDQGHTWTEYDKNPVVKHAGRDPKLVWHEKAKHWVMAVYDEFQGKQWIAFHTSPDLKTWTFASRIEGFYECPDLFELPIEEQVKMPETKWILYAADGKYLTGDFDGKEFKPDSKDKKQLWYGRFYAAQTFDNAPSAQLPFAPHMVRQRNLRIQIGWANGVTFPGMPFNQQMTVPVSLSLLKSNAGPRLTAYPYGVHTLHEQKPVVGIGMEFGSTSTHWLPDGSDDKQSKVLSDDLDAFDLSTELDPNKAKKITFDLRGTKLVYDVAKQTLTCKDVTAPVKMTSPENDSSPKHLTLRVLVDRGSIEVFADGGMVAMSIAAIPDEKNRKVELHVEGDAIDIQQMSIHKMKSAWVK